jgi:aminomethyltransferase
MPEGKCSPLEPQHLSLGARMVPFAGWNMPVQYSSIIEEHRAVREAAGIFDISHMGQVAVEGPQAARWLDEMLTNHLGKLTDGQGQYTLMLNPQGGVIDDLIAYRRGPDAFFLVVNASKHEEDLAWLRSHAPAGVTIRDESPSRAGMAVQGPDALALLARALPGSETPPRNGMSSRPDGITICRTGYTGEDGFECFCPAESAAAIWQTFVEAGAKPCGLGARDTLRLEMGFPLNGNDLSPSRTPLEAGLGVFCDLTKPAFIGREVLLRQKEEGLPSRLVAIRCLAKGAPPRAHYPVLTADGSPLGELTSGALSPTLETGIGMAYLPPSHSTPGTRLLIAIRDRTTPAEVVKKPFLPKR